jgi:hypothetical protein
MEEARKKVVNTYVKHRILGDVDPILKLFAPECVIIDSDTKKTEYKKTEESGDDVLRSFLVERPPPSITPLISDPVLNNDGTITITLSAIVKKLHVTFSFANESSLINKIVLVESGLLSGWF